MYTKAFSIKEEFEMVISDVNNEIFISKSKNNTRSIFHESSMENWIVDSWLWWFEFLGK